MASSTAKRRQADDPFSRVTALLGGESVRIHSAIELHERIAEGLPRQWAVHLVSSLHAIKFDESLRALNMSDPDRARGRYVLVGQERLAIDTRLDPA